MNANYRWLNELSQIFLERDYLVEHQTVDQRVDIICNTAERILNKPGFAKRFKENFQKGWYSLSTPIWTNFGNDRGLPISCVTGDTWINTKYDGGKQAKDIKIGDEVLTHKGRYKKVTNVIVTKNRENIYKLKVQGRMTNLHITENHLVLTNMGWVRVDELDPHSHLIATHLISEHTEDPDFILSSKDLKLKLSYKETKDGLYYCPIAILEKTNKVEDVYDFTVEEDHSFSASGVVLHNCFGSTINDQMDSIVTTWAEVAMMTKHGGGTSAYFGNLRCRGSEIRKNGTSSGSVHFMQAFENLINVISQGSTRRGNFAAYLPIDHPDIMEFLQIRTEGFPIQHIHSGVTVPDYWMEQMIAGDAEKRKVWAKVLQMRSSFGEPYVIFIDNANNNTADCYKNQALKITHSNLCSEILLPDNQDESFVCDLSSMNILYYDEWKNTDAVELLVYLLDAVMTEFIEKAKNVKFMERAVRFAERHRALGVGWLGWHSFLQSKMIPWESMEAKLLNSQIAKNIRDAAYKASEKLAQEYGEPEVLKGYGRRNTTLLAIAPTKSSAFILGQVSEGIEPNITNYYIKDLQKGKFTIKNVELVKLLQSKGQDTDEVWKSILLNGGSVQHLDCLTELEKNVFKTFAEISPKEIIIQAAQRQKYIDQGQSLNLMIHPTIPTKDINALMIEAWKMGVKGLYYQHSINAAQNFSRKILECSSCQA